MSEKFELGGRSFSLLKLSAFKQFHIVRKIGPILADLVPVASHKAKEMKGMSEGDKLEFLAQFAAPVLQGMSKLSDKDAEFVLFGLLQAVEVKQSAGNWAKLSNGEMLLIEEFELPTLMQLAGRAFMHNLSGFFAALN